jgi:uncharacterized protein
MKILVDIGHPAHVHFYYRPIQLWLNDGHDVIVTSRHKEIATDLLDALQVQHHVLSSMNNGSIRGMVSELISRDLKLLRVVIKERPDVMTGIGGIYVAHTGFLTRIPSVVFYDTENASLSNLITYPFSRLVVVPDCYSAWLPPWNLKYPGYHELSYLNPDHFVPDRGIATECGLDPARPTFLIRTVSWQASHDLDEKGWNLKLLTQLVRFLENHGKVIISAEGELPEKLRKYKYEGAVEKIHHLMAFLSLFVGESATMASECAVLGVPAIYAANTGRGYTDEQESKYQLVFNIRDLDWSTMKAVITEILDTSVDTWPSRRNKLLADTIDVAEFVANLTVNYPGSVKKYKKAFSGDRA